MRRDIFGELVNPPVGTPRRSLIAIVAAMFVEVAAIAVLVVVPLMIVGVVPKPPSMMAFIDPSVPPSPPPVAPRREQPIAQSSHAAPLEPPNEILPEPQIEAGFERDVPSGGVVIGTTEGVPEPPPPTRVATTPEAPIHVGGVVRPPQKTKDVAPIYPAIAQAARVQGFVIIEAVIGPDGGVREARVLRSIPLLDQAALAAVKQWEFTPTLLNGQPVPVIMTVTVQFTLR